MDFMILSMWSLYSDLDKLRFWEQDIIKEKKRDKFIRKLNCIS